MSELISSPRYVNLLVFARNRIDSLVSASDFLYDTRTPCLVLRNELVWKTFWAKWNIQREPYAHYTQMRTCRKRWNLSYLDLGQADSAVDLAENPIVIYLPLCRAQCPVLCWGVGDGAFGPLRTHFHWHLLDGCNESAIRMHGRVYSMVLIRVVLLFAWNTDCYCVYVFPLGFQFTSKNDSQIKPILKIVTLTEKFSARYNIISQLWTIEFKSKNHWNPPFLTVFHLKETHFQTCRLHLSYNTQLTWSDHRNPTWKHFPDSNYS